MGETPVIKVFSELNVNPLFEAVELITVIEIKSCAGNASSGKVHKLVNREL